jgi:hypothetical protein
MIINLIKFIAQAGIVYYFVRKLIVTLFPTDEDAMNTNPGIDHDVNVQFNASVTVVAAIMRTYPIDSIVRLPEYYALQARCMEIDKARMVNALDNTTVLRYIQAANDFVSAIEQDTYNNPK